MIFSCVSLAADLAILAVLYLSLPGTAKTGHARYVLRFACIWAFGDVGVRWSMVLGYPDSVLRVVLEIVALVGMAAMPALLTHLAWLTTMELKDVNEKSIVERYQLAVYIVSMAFIGVAFILRDGFDLSSRAFTILFNAWAMGCLAWSVIRFTGQGYDGSPAIERRSRSMLATGAGFMFFLALIDLLQTVSGMPDLALTTGLQFVAMALIGWGFLTKGKFIIAPAKGTVARKMAGGGLHLSPGKLYISLGKGPEDGVISLDLLRGESRRGRPMLVITDRKAEFYRKRKGLEDVPVARYVSEDWDGPEGIDIMMDDELAMLPWIVEEFALEAWELDKEGDKSTGSTVIIDDAHVLMRVAGKAGTKEALKAIAKVVKGSDQLRVVVLADRAALGKGVRMFERRGTPLEVAHP